MAARLNIKDSISQWIDKINALMELQNVDGAFINNDTSWTNTTFSVTGGKVRSGTNVLDIPGADVVLPTANVNLVGVDVINEVLTSHVEGSVPIEGFIPLYVVTTNNERITGSEDARTWAYEDSGVVLDHEGKADPHGQYALMDELALDYATGLDIESRNQIVYDSTSGFYWRLSGSTALPYTTTGTGLPEGGAFVSVGDAALRAQLADNTAALGSSLVAHTGTTDTVTDALDKRTIYVGSVAGLEALSLPVGASVKLTDNGVAGAGVIKSGTPPTDPLKGKYVVIANGNYWERDTKGFLFPQFFGSGGADDQAAIEACRDMCATTGDALGLRGTYTYATSPNLAVSNLKIMPFGEVVFTHIGTGSALIIDAGATSGLVTSLEMTGPIIVEGNANSGSVLLRALIQCKVDIEVREMTATAFDVQFGVLSKYTLASTINRKNMTLVPTKGMMVDQRGTGEFNAACGFDVIFEGIDGLGVDLVRCSHATITGTSEGNVGGGIRDSANCAGNTWQDFYCEVNQGLDFELYGKRNHLINATALSPSGNTVELITAEATTFEGGFLRAVNCQSASKNSTFIGISTSDNVALGIKGAGTKRIINCVEVDIDGNTTAYTQDVMGESGVWAPTLSGATTAGSVTYTTRTGNYSVVGNLMSFSIDLTISGLGGASGTALLSIPPGYVSEATGNQSIMVDEISGVSLSGTGAYLSARLGSGSGTMTLIAVNPGGANAGQSVSGFPSGSIIRLTGSIVVSKV